MSRALRAEAALPWVAALALGALALAAAAYTVDDAYVLARYAARLAAGRGYTMNDGPPTDGVTGPLGLAPGVLAALTGGDPLRAAKLAGGLAAVLAVWLTVRRAEGLAHRASTALLAVVGGALPVWAVAGLETGLATLAFTIMGLALGEGRPSTDELDQEAPQDVVHVSGSRPDPLASGLALGLAVAALAWLRPELAPAALVALLLAPAGRGRWLAWAVALAGLTSILAFRLVLFDALLPLSARAKPAELGHGLDYAARGLALAYGGVGAALVGLALSGRHRGAGHLRAIALVLLAHLAGVVIGGGDWMPGFRLFAPAVPLYALVAGGVLAGLSPRWRALGLVASLALPAFALSVALAEVPATEASREGPGRELAGWLRAHARRVALVDVGLLAYHSGVEVVDLGGITDPRIGGLPGGHADKAVDAGLLSDRDPDVIVLSSRARPRVDGDRLIGLAGHPVERRVAAMPWVARHFRVERVVAYAPAYYYVVLVRRSPR